MKTMVGIEIYQSVALTAHFKIIILFKGHLTLNAIYVATEFQNLYIFLKIYFYRGDTKRPHKE